MQPAGRGGGVALTHIASRCAQLHKEELLIALTEQNRKLNESLLREQLAARAVNQARSRQLVQAPGTNTTGSTSKVNGFTATVINPFASVYVLQPPMRRRCPCTHSPFRPRARSSRRIGRPSIFMQRKGSGGSGRTEQTGSQSSLRDVTTGDSTRSMFQQASDQKLMAASNDMSLAAAVRLRMEDHSNVGPQRAHLLAVLRCTRVTTTGAEADLPCPTCRQPWRLGNVRSH